MKTGKKFWSILLALVMLLSMVAPAVYAETTDESNEITIESVTALPVTFTEGVHSSFTIDNEGNEIGIYHPLHKDAVFVVTYSDGSSAECQWYEISDAASDITDSVDTNAWTVGEYIFQIEIGGYEIDIPVIIEANPVASVTAEPVTLYEGIHQYKGLYWDDETQSEVEGKLFSLWDMNCLLNVTFTDGTTKTLTPNELRELDMEVGIMMGDSQTKNWTAGNTYEVSVTVSGRECTVAVTVASNPAASVRVPDISMKASQSWDGFYSFEEHLKVEITMADGTVHTLSLYDLYDHDVYPEIYDPQYEGEQFVPGQTYTIDYMILGHEGQFKLDILDDSIKSITAEAQYSLYETLSSGVHNLENTDPIITVTRNDGTSVTFPYSERWNYINSDVLLELADVPDSGYLAAGGHKVSVVIEGVAGEFTVNVLENPVESFTVTAKYPFIKNEEGNYSYEAVPHAITLKLKDGTTETYTDPYELYEKYHTYDVIPYLITDPEAPLTVGTHEVDAVLMGMRCKQTVTIVDAGITSVTGSYDGVLIENVSGWLTGDVDANGEWIEYFHYMIEGDLFRFTVTYADGTQQTLGVDDSFMGSQLGNVLSMEDPQNGQNPWKLGKNKISGSMLGHKFEIEIEVVENTIKDITVKATKPLYLGWHVVDAYGGEVYLDTRQAGLEITVTYTDDTTKTYTYDEFAEEFNQVGVSPAEGNTAGTKTAHLWFGNDGIEFEVEVKENPVKSVTVEPSKTLTQSKEGWYDIRETVPVYTVTYTDGTTDTFYGNSQIIEKFDIYPTWDDRDDLEVGKNTIDVTVFGHTVKYTFEIVKAANPLTKVTAKAVAPLYVSSDPYHDYYDYTALVEVTLTYADGTTKTVMANELRNTQGYSDIYFYDNQNSVQWSVGKYDVTAEYKGFEAKFTVEVVENPYVKLTISADNGLTVTLEKKDGTKEVRTAKSYQVDGAAKIGTAGNLVTDMGSMFVVFYFKDGNQENIAYMEYNGLKSNALNDCKWLSQQMAMQGTGNVSIDRNMQELIDLVDKNAYRVWMTVTELAQSSIPGADAAKIQAAIPSGYKAAVTLDLNLYKESDYGVFQISKTAEAVGITVAVPQGLIGTNEVLDGFKVIRLHNGVAEVLDAAYNKKADTISFQTDKFSTYTVVYSAHQQKPGTGTNPGTGDETPLVLLFVLTSVSAVLLSGVTVLGRKKIY